MDKNDQVFCIEPTEEMNYLFFAITILHHFKHLKCCKYCLFSLRYLVLNLLLNFQKSWYTTFDLRLHYLFYYLFYQESLFSPAAVPTAVPTINTALHKPRPPPPVLSVTSPKADADEEHAAFTPKISLTPASAPHAALPTNRYLIGSEVPTTKKCCFFISIFQVQTPQGLGKVKSYRDEDHMYQVELYWQLAEVLEVYIFS